MNRGEAQPAGYVSLYFQAGPLRSAKVDEVGNDAQVIAVRRTARAAASPRGGPQISHTLVRVLRRLRPEPNNRPRNRNAPKTIHACR